MLCRQKWLIANKVKESSSMAFNRVARMASTNENNSPRDIPGAVSLTCMDE